MEINGFLELYYNLFGGYVWSPVSVNTDTVISVTDLVSWVACGVSVLLKHTMEVLFIHVILEHYLYNM